MKYMSSIFVNYDDGFIIVDNYGLINTIIYAIMTKDISSFYGYSI